MSRQRPFALLAAFLTTVAFLGGLHAISGEREAEQPADPLDALVGLMLEIDDADVRHDVLKGMEAALRGRRKVGVPRGWNTLFPQLVESNDPELRQLATRLALVFGDQSAMRSLRDLAGDRDASVADREMAVKALAGISDAKLLPILLRLVDEPAVRPVAVRALAGYDDDRVPTVLLTRYAELEAAEKRDAIATLSARSHWAVVLLEAIGDERIPSSDLSAYDARHLAGLGNEDVTRLLGEVWGDVRPTKADRTRLMREYARELTPDLLAKADRSAGRAIYKQTCAGCHHLFDDGRRVGPELTGSQRFNVDYLLQNLLDPNAIIGRDYRMTTIVTDSGRILSGLVKEETDNAIVLLTANETVTIPAEEIEVVKQATVSMMPEGILQKMTADQRRDLFAYLAGSTQVPLPSATN